MKTNTQKFKRYTYARGVIAIVASIFMLGAPMLSVYAQDTMTYTVTPPLFKPSIAPGQEWKSVVKVVNSNSYEIPIYANVMNFEAKEDVAGQGSFIPIINDDPEFIGHTLGDWIQITDGPTFIGQGQSAEIPFTIVVPEDAEPGGHYAAILLGTRPLETEGIAMNISSYVSALVFVTVEGEVVEDGKIREFSTANSIYQAPDVTFKLRFENTGNVHVLPQGNIIIYNMWGKERGRIPVNGQTDYGNVLPGTVRKFEFDWSGEANFFEVGRYKAIATVAYGSENRKSDYWTAYFWVIPVKPALYVFGSFFTFIFFVFWSIRRYVRRAVQMEKRFINANIQLNQPIQPTQSAQPVRQKAPDLKTLTRPLVIGAVDLRNTVKTTHTVSDKGQHTTSLGEFIKKYRLFLLFILVLIIAGIAASVYFKEVLVSERDYNYSVVEEV